MHYYFYYFIDEISALNLIYAVKFVRFQKISYIKSY